RATRDTRSHRPRVRPLNRWLLMIGPSPFETLSWVSCGPARIRLNRFVYLQIRQPVRVSLDSGPELGTENGVLPGVSTLSQRSPDGKKPRAGRSNRKQSKSAH